MILDTIGTSEVESFFKMSDDDGSGSVNIEEFKDALIQCATARGQVDWR